MLINKDISEIEQLYKNKERYRKLFIKTFISDQANSSFKISEMLLKKYL